MDKPVTIKDLLTVDVFLSLIDDILDPKEDSMYKERTPDRRFKSFMTLLYNTKQYWKEESPELIAYVYAILNAYIKAHHKNTDDSLSELNYNLQNFKKG